MDNLYRVRMSFRGGEIYLCIFFFVLVCAEDFQCNKKVSSFNIYSNSTTSGKVQSFGYPGPYDPTPNVQMRRSGKSCKFNFYFGSSKYLLLEAENIDLAEYDYLMIDYYDTWNSNKDPPTPMLIRKSPNEDNLEVELAYSGGLKTMYATGFSINYSFHDSIPSELGSTECRHTYAGPEGSIISPGFPNANYTNNLLCIYEIKSTTNLTVISINELELERNGTKLYDFIIVSDGIDQYRLTGQEPRTHYFYSDAVEIIFITDSANVYKGFNITFSSLDFPFDYDLFQSKAKGWGDIRKDISKTGNKIIAEVFDKFDFSNTVLLGKVNEFRILLNNLLGYSYGISKFFDYKTLRKVMSFYSQVHAQRSTYDEIVARGILDRLVSNQLLKKFKKHLDEALSNTQFLLECMGELEKRYPGFVIPGWAETVYSLRNLDPEDRTIFFEMTNHTLIAVQALRELEILYSNMDKYTGKNSSPPYNYISLLVRTTIELANKLNAGVELYLKNEDKLERKRKGVATAKWFKDNDGYLEVNFKLGKIKELVTKVSEFRDLNSFQGTTPEDFLRTSFKTVDTLLAGDLHFNKFVDEL